MVNGLGVSSPEVVMGRGLVAAVVGVSVMFLLWFV